jgi:hypothetical protein
VTTADETYAFPSPLASRRRLSERREDIVDFGALGVVRAYVDKSHDTTTIEDQNDETQDTSGAPSVYGVVHRRDLRTLDTGLKRGV